MKTKCLMWVETKLKILEDPIIQPVSLANFTNCNGTKIVDSYVREETAEIL